MPWTIVAMDTSLVTRFTRTAQAAALLAVPLLWMLMLLLHFRSPAEFFVYREHYIPVPAADTVAHLIAARNRWPMLHDPHQIGYLSLPMFVLAAFGVFEVGRRTRPALATLGIALTVTGSISVGGVFGLFTALTRGLGEVDARYTDGAIATYAAATADRGAYGLTRALAELALVGLACQALALWHAPRLPQWSPLILVTGCALFLRYWDVDNMMFAGSLCVLLGFMPVSRELRRLATGSEG